MDNVCKGIKKFECIINTIGSEKETKVSEFIEFYKACSKEEQEELKFFLFSISTFFDIKKMLDTYREFMRQDIELFLELFNFEETSDYGKLSEYEVNHTHYPYIALSTYLFLFTIKKVLNAHPNLKSLSFLDVGAGIGEKVVIASYFFENVFGIEYNKVNVEISRNIYFCLLRNRLVNKNEIFKEGDALDFDYKDYDVIYYYRPMTAQEQMDKLFEKIIKTAKPGTFILSFLYESPNEYIENIDDYLNRSIENGEKPVNCVFEVLNNKKVRFCFSVWKE